MIKALSSSVKGILAPNKKENVKLSCQPLAKKARTADLHIAASDNDEDDALRQARTSDGGCLSRRSWRARYLKRFLHASPFCLYNWNRSTFRNNLKAR